MSDYGFEIQNIYGQIIADTNYPVYTILTSGSFTIGGNLQFSYVDVTFPPVDISNMPQVMFEMNGSTIPLCLMGYLMSGSSVYGVRVHSYNSSNAYININFIVVVPINAANIPTPIYGVEAYDLNGRKTFSSGARLVTVKHIQTFTAGSVISHPTITGSRYVSISSVTGFRWIIFQYPYAYSSWNGVYGINSTQIGTTWNIYSVVAPTNVSPTYTYNATIMICELGA